MTKKSKFEAIAKQSEKIAKEEPVNLEKATSKTPKKAPAKKKPKEERSTQVQTYITPSEMKQLENSLKPRESVSPWVRGAILEKLKKSS